MTKQTKSAEVTGKKPFLSDKLVLGIYLIILFFSFFYGYNRIFDKKIFLGGDNAGYYILGQSIATGNGYTNIHQVNQKEHNHFPPGYPAIIAVVSKVFSNDIVFLKRLNGFFLLASVLLMFFIVRELTDNVHIAFITGLLSALNYHLLNYSTIMMSEVPFLFFTSLCFWLLLKTDLQKPFYKNWVFLMLIVCVAFTYYIRSLGLGLLVGVTLFMAFRKNWSYLLAFLAGVVVLILPWYLRSKALGGSSYARQLFRKNPYRPELGEMEISDWFTRFWTNFERYITREIPSGSFNFFEVANYQEAVSSGEWVTGILLVAIMLFGLIKLKKYTPLILFYTLSVFGILLLWPDVWFGIRFLIPLIPFLIFFFVLGLAEIVNLLVKRSTQKDAMTYISIGMAILSIVLIPTYTSALKTLEVQAKTPISNSFRNYFELANWVKTNTPANSVTSCRKNQLFYLYSGKYVTGFKSTLDKEELIADLEKKDTDYVVLDQLGYSSTVRYLYPAIQRHPEKFKVVKHLKNPDTYLMKFQPEMGYTGEWKDDQKHGQGTYVWENDQKFVGQWKNNKKDGPGTLYYPNGDKLEGNWSDDKLEGEAVFTSKDGNTVEKRMFRDNQPVQP